MKRNHPAGSALVVTLVFVVLVALALLAFFSQVQNAFLVSRSGHVRVDTNALVDSAVEATVSDLRMEMLAGAVASSSRTSFNSFDPLTVTNRWAMVPARVVSTNVPTTGYENLVKQSLNGVAFYPGATAASTYAANGPAGATGTERASAVNTATASANGRTISANRWDQTALNTAPLPANALPDWIYVTRGGIPEDASALTTSTIANSDLGNTNYVIGRYAYNIYDTGGLLNANAAGYPSSQGAEAAKKGGLPWADLTVLGLTGTEVQTLVAFRNAQTSAATNYVSLIRNQAELNGFLSPVKVGSASDGFFYTRADLLQFFLNVFGQTKIADCDARERTILASLVHDQRFFTAPSWMPDPNRNMILAASSGGNNSQGLDNIINTQVTGVAVGSTTLTRLRLDSSGNPTRNVAAVQGEPLVNSRFPLSRLSLITRTATADTNSAIYNYFGLTRASTSAPWVYSHGSSQAILTLSQVRAKNREPDMVELLKAAILAGSLGKSAGTVTSGGTWGNNFYHQLDGQVIQIFANLIDQASTDGYPTAIQFYDSSGSNIMWTYWGVKNLPYLNRIKMFCPRLLPDSQAFAANDPYTVAFLPEIWNPHDPGVAAPSDRPTRIRVVADSSVPGVTGSFTTYPMQYQVNDTGTWTQFDTPNFQPSVNNFELDTTTINATEPVVVKNGFPTNATTAPDETKFIHCANFNYPNATGSFGFRSVSVDSYPGIAMALEYYDPADSSWHRYFERRIDMTGNATSGSVGTSRGRSSPAYYQKQLDRRSLASDPRTDRFGFYNMEEVEVPATSPPSAYTDTTYLSSANDLAGQGFTWWTNYNLSYDAGWTLTPDPGGLLASTPVAAQGSTVPHSYSIASILQNIASSPTRYKDPDGVLRPGDGSLASGTGPEGQMHWANNVASRPIVLNRPFCSVGEMGYTFRGTPCRSLDFYSAASGDAALLDFFSASEVPDDGLTAARVSANTRNPLVVQSLLSGALADPATGTMLSASRAATVAQELVTSTSSAPLLNRSELVTQFLAKLDIDSNNNSERIKRQREVYVRALADSMETRSWNFLIDLIVQTGRIPKSTPSLDQFRVESERHVWVHLSIDRLTGRILRISQEPSNDLL